jgi:acyl-CoA thioesterase
MTTIPPADPQTLAEAVANKMLAEDLASQSMGMRILASAPGYSRVSMTIRENMLNGHSTCHGGIIFSLADSAFAFACNSYNHTTVAQSCDIDFLTPGRLGDELTAEAVEQAIAGRSGIYDVTVSNQKGERIAFFRGRSRRIPGEILSST